MYEGLICMIKICKEGWIEWSYQEQSFKNTFVINVISIQTGLLYIKIFHSHINY